MGRDLSRTGCVFCYGWSYQTQVSAIRWVFNVASSLLAPLCFPRINHNTASRLEGTDVSCGNDQAVGGSDGRDVAVCAGDSEPSCTRLCHQLCIGLRAGKIERQHASGEQRQHSRL
jgi:hypothetical protein